MGHNWMASMNSQPLAMRALIGVGCLITVATAFSIPGGADPNDDNFIDALRSRDKTKLNGPIEEGALSVTLMHLANISYKVGRSLNIDPATGAVIGDSEAARLYRRDRYRAPFVVPEKV